MNKEKILENLETKKLGRNFIYYEEIDSTQKIAKQLAEKKVEDGTVIFADYQTAGIGTHDRKWYSNKGENIAFTFLLYPNCNINKLNNLTIEIAGKIIGQIKFVCFIFFEFVIPTKFFQYNCNIHQVRHDNVA